jgi:formylmethanofuran dehydrogenase subunit E
MEALEGQGMALTIEATVQCSRCSAETPESEILELGSWWVCGICWDDL